MYRFFLRTWDYQTFNIDVYRIPVLVTSLARSVTQSWVFKLRISYSLQWLLMDSEFEGNSKLKGISLVGSPLGVYYKGSLTGSWSIWNSLESFSPLFHIHFQIKWFD